jgi:hypothetical protein
LAQGAMLHQNIGAGIASLKLLLISLSIYIHCLSYLRLPISASSLFFISLAISIFLTISIFLNYTSKRKKNSIGVDYFAAFVLPIHGDIA